MARGEPTYRITPEWKKRVREAIAALGISESEFARRAGISKAALSEALSNDKRTSALVPAIHRTLGLPVPLEDVPDEVLDFVHFLLGMDPRDFAAARERAYALDEIRRSQSKKKS